MKWLDDPGEFGPYLKSLGVKKPAEGWHAHHILFKRGFGPKQQELVREAQDILWAVGINPIFGREVLVWARNIKGQHVLPNLEPIVEALREVAARPGGPTYEAVVGVLDFFGEKAKNLK